MEGRCEGVTVAWSHHSCTMGGHTLAHGDIQMSKICMWGVTQLSSGGMCHFPLFFSQISTQTLAEHSIGPCLSCFFMHMHPLPSQNDLDIYELGLTCILLLSLLLLCISGEGNDIRPCRGSAEAEAITAAIIRLVWFMIYAERGPPEVTPLEELGSKNLF